MVYLGRQIGRYIRCRNCNDSANSGLGRGDRELLERPYYRLGKIRKGLSELVKSKMRYRTSDKEAVARWKETGEQASAEETAGAEVWSLPGHVGCSGPCQGAQHGRRE